MYNGSLYLEKEVIEEIKEEIDPNIRETDIIFNAFLEFATINRQIKADKDQKAIKFYPNDSLAGMVKYINQEPGYINYALQWDADALPNNRPSSDLQWFQTYLNNTYLKRISAGINALRALDSELTEVDKLNIRHMMLPIYD